MSEPRYRRRMESRIAVAVCGLAALLAIAGGRESTAAAGVTACELSWSVVPSPAVAGGELRAVAAAAPDDAWAAGGPSRAWWVTPRPTALIEHWDGTQWTVVASPQVTGALEDVAVAGRNDVWAVGELGDAASSSGGTSALVEHWNGLGWTQVAVTGLRDLSAVAATSGHDVWAAGSDPHGAAVIVHWAGSRWIRVVRRAGAELRDLVAISPHDVWAVGDETGSRFLEMHWDGKRWTSYSELPPNGGYGLDYDPALTAVAAIGRNNVYAAGDAANSGEPDWADTVVLHWNGTAWRHAAPDGSLVWVSALAMRGPADVWLAGLTGDYLGYGPVVQRWRGTRWQTTTLVDGQEFDGLATDHSGGLWAVGDTGSGENDDNGFPAQTAAIIERAACA